MLLEQDQTFKKRVSEIAVAQTANFTHLFK